MATTRYVICGIRALAVLAFTAYAVTLAPKSAYADDVRIGTIKIPGSVTAGQVYMVELSGVQKTGDTVRVVKACFSWDFEGPYCFPARETSGSIIMRLRTNNPNTYWLSAFLKYEYAVPGEAELKEGKSNEVKGTLVVRP